MDRGQIQERGEPLLMEELLNEEKKVTVRSTPLPKDDLGRVERHHWSYAYWHIVHLRRWSRLRILL